MNFVAKPTVSEAVEAAGAIKRLNAGCGWLATVTVILALVLVYYQPLGLIAIFVILVWFAGYHEKKCEPNWKILREFARNRNWFLPVGTELRHVPNHYRRKRFYSEPRLIEGGSIVARVLSGDFSIQPAPPSGEVPRTSPSFSGATTSRGGGSSGRSNQSPLDSHIEKHRVEEERRLEQQRLRIDEERRQERERFRIEEERRLEEERKRAAEEERRREEERKRVEEEEKRRVEEEKRRAEELRRCLEEPRFELFIDGAWAGPFSVKEIWRKIQDGKVNLTDYAIDKATGTISPLIQFSELTALFTELAVSNSVKIIKQYKRTKKERDECINFHGTICAVCGFSFEQEFGEIGKDYIEVHHLKPVAQFASSPVRIVNPIADLRPVCANCHRMLHMRNPPLSVEELIEIRSRQSSK
ncbi:MAG: HNH endonuclease [Prosthecobacter sp.]